MHGDLPLHVVHASVTYFDGICIAYFVKRVGARKGLLNDGQELFANVGFYIIAPGWVKPGDFSISILFAGGFVPGIGVKF